jgi:hypothetical protein
VGPGTQAAPQPRGRTETLDDDSDLLDKGDVENLVVALRSIDSSNPELAEAVRSGQLF